MDDIYDPKFVKDVFDRYLFHLKVILSLVERTLLRGAQDFSIHKILFRLRDRRCGPPAGLSSPARNSAFFERNQSIANARSETADDCVNTKPLG
jgi:hypothetical protein